jgi:hypothetical protein
MEDITKYEAMLSESPGTLTPKDSYTVKEFSQLIGRSYDWTLDKIRLHRLTNGRSGIRVLPLGTPYQVPASELLRIKGGGK